MPRNYREVAKILAAAPAPGGSYVDFTTQPKLVDRCESYYTYELPNPSRNAWSVAMTSNAGETWNLFISPGRAVRFNSSYQIANLSVRVAEVPATAPR